MRNYFFRSSKSILSRLILVLTVMLYGCSSPTEQFKKVATANNLKGSQIAANSFNLQVFSNNIRGQHLNIYLDGDGTPWLRGIRPAPDPTPRSLLSLKLMLLDEGPAIYIGRPCYFELGPSELCTNNLWTQDRYSEKVVNSLNSALSNLLNNHNYQSVQLIGFSGGGALAVLIANRRDDIDSIITIAGNLNTHTWTQHHGYLPLIGSLNPADEPSLAIPSLHLIGGRDSAVPPKVIHNYLNNHSGKHRLFSDFDHHCCWLDKWPEILQHGGRQ